MASYGILGFLQGAGEAGGRAAEEAQRSHNENARLKMAAELENKRMAQQQDFQRETYQTQRQDEVADRDLQREDALSAQLANEGLKREQIEAQSAISAREWEQKKELERMKIGNRPGNYSDISVGINPETGERDQFRLDNRTGEKQWMGVGVPTNPLDDVKLRKAEADAVVSEGKVKDLDAKAAKTGVIQDNAIKIVDRLLKDESSLRAVTGGFDASKWSPTVMQPSIDAENDLNALRSLLTMDNLDAMTGVLSESDILMLKEVSAAGLNPSNSTARVKEALETVRNRMKASRGSTGATGGWGEEEAKTPTIDQNRASELRNKWLK